MAEELTVMYQGQQCLIRKDQYINGRPAISLVNKSSGRRIAMATIDAREDKASTSFVLVKDFGHEQDPLHLLQERGLLTRIGERITNGFMWFRECELNI